mgnify:CR=1 FL=1
MQWPDKDSPFWPTFRVAARAAVLLFGLWMFYARLDPRDLKTFLTCIFADAGLSALGAMQRKDDK